MTRYFVLADLFDLLELGPLVWEFIKKQYVGFHFLVVLHVSLAQSAYSGASVALERLCSCTLSVSGLTSVYSSHVASDLMPVLFPVLTL
jgi:hypothetical protein